jgi:MYXO-CTERM domain-containing protein
VLASVLLVPASASYAAPQSTICGCGIEVTPMPTFPDTFRNPGGQAPVRALRIRNLDEAPLRLTAVIMTDATDVWQLVDPSPIELAQGMSHEIRVRFSPKQAGQAPVAKLQVTNDEDNMKLMVSVDLNGRGIDRSVMFASDTLRIAYAGVGVPVTIEDALIVANNDTLNTFTIRSIELDPGSPFKIEGQTSGIELPALGEQRFAVTVTPEAKGQFTAKARLYLDMDPEAQDGIEIEGTAVFVDAHGGGGCAASDTAGSKLGAVLILVTLASRRRRRRHHARADAAIAAATAVAV